MLKTEIIKKCPNSYGALGEIVYGFYSEQLGKSSSVIADKNNYYINHLEELKEIWPDAKFILVIRDGRDVACSYKNIETLVTNSPYKPKLPVSTELIAKEWLDNNQNVLNFFNTFSSADSLLVRYEDVLSETTQTLSEVCKFLDEPFDENMLSYYLNSAQNAEPASTLDWKKKTLEKPDPENIGKYKVELPQNEIEKFNSIAKNLLVKFNYEI